MDHIIRKANRQIRGILHIGAHLCEEEPFYKQFTDVKNIYWVEANPEICKQAFREGRNIINVVISDQDDQIRDFIITNNYQSSSLLELHLHKQEHAWVHETERVKCQTMTVDTLITKLNNPDINMLSMDVQGAELLVLKGATKLLENIDVLMTEVNIIELYKDCCLINQLDKFLLQYNLVRMNTDINGHGWGDALYVRFPLKS